MTKTIYKIMSNYSAISYADYNANTERYLNGYNITRALIDNSQLWSESATVLEEFDSREDAYRALYNYTSELTFMTAYNAIETEMYYVEEFYYDEDGEEECSMIEGDESYADFNLKDYSYSINYGNGNIEDDIVTDDVNDVKELADNGASYTGQDIKIYDYNNQMLARRPWYGVECDPEELTDKMIDFGDYGYYGEWQNE